MSVFVWTSKGHRIHVSDDGWFTRCGWEAATKKPSADEVVFFWPPCAKCIKGSR